MTNECCNVFQISFSNDLLIKEHFDVSIVVFVLEVEKPNADDELSRLNPNQSENRHFLQGVGCMVSISYAKAIINQDLSMK